jgi:hypothetical protein
MGGSCNTHGSIVMFGRKAWRKDTTRKIRRRRLEDNIRMDLREIGWEGVDWMHLA